MIYKYGLGSFSRRTRGHSQVASAYYIIKKYLWYLVEEPVNVSIGPGAVTAKSSPGSAVHKNYFILSVLCFLCAVAALKHNKGLYKQVVCYFFGDENAKFFPFLQSVCG
jgi:hypothetical protein